MVPQDYGGALKLALEGYARALRLGAPAASSVGFLEGIAANLHAMAAAPTQRGRRLQCLTASADAVTEAMRAAESASSAPAATAASRKRSKPSKRSADSSQTQNERRRR